MTGPCMLVIVLVVAYMCSLAVTADSQELRSQQPGVGDTLHSQRSFRRQPAAATPFEALNIFPQISAVIVKSGRVLDRNVHWTQLVPSPSV
jgi:hypothetical protein